MGENHTYSIYLEGFEHFGLEKVDEFLEKYLEKNDGVNSVQFSFCEINGFRTTIEKVREED